MVSLKQALKNSRRVEGARASFTNKMYNLVPRPAVIFVDKEAVQVMERREAFADMVSRYQDISLENPFTSTDG